MSKESSAQSHDFGMAQFAYANNLAMWHRQNEYNSPANQLARYQDAGLNPNLMYGNISSGNATQMPQMQKPNTYVEKTFAQRLQENLAPVLNFFQGYSQVKKDEAQINLLNSQASYVDQQRQESFNRTNYWLHHAGLEGLNYEEKQAARQYFADNAYYNNEILHSNYRQGLMQENIQYDLLKHREFERAARKVEHNLEKSKLSFAQKMETKRYLEDMRQFNTRMRYDIQKYNADSKFRAATFNADYNQRENHFTRQQRFKWADSFFNHATDLLNIFVKK